MAPTPSNSTIHRSFSAPPALPITTNHPANRQPTGNSTVLPTQPAGPSTTTSTASTTNPQSPQNAGPTTTTTAETPPPTNYTTPPRPTTISPITPTTISPITPTTISPITPPIHHGLGIYPTDTAPLPSFPLSTLNSAVAPGPQRMPRQARGLRQRMRWRNEEMVRREGREVVRGEEVDLGEESEGEVMVEESEEEEEGGGSDDDDIWYEEWTREEMEGMEGEGDEDEAEDEEMEG